MSDQNRPPAGRAQFELGQLPACSQLQTKTDPTGLTHYYVTRDPDISDGQIVALYSGQSGINHTWLDSAGICKIGGTDIVLTKPTGFEAIQYIDLQPIPTEANTPQWNGLTALLIVSGIAYAAYQQWLSHQTSEPIEDDDDDEQEEPSWLID